MRTFFDEVHAWTFSKGLPQQDRIAIRLALRQAKRFVVDEKLSSYIEELVDAEEERLPDWTLLARLPFEHVWLEKETADAFSVVEQGMLLSRVGGDSCRWTASEFMYNDNPLPMSAFDGVVLNVPSVFVVNTEGDAEHPPYASDFPPIYDLFPSLFPRNIEHSLWSSEQGSKAKIPAREHWFSDKVYISTSHFWRKVFASQVKDRRKGFEESFYPMLKNSWIGFKTAIVTLAVINDVPVNLTEVRPPKGRHLRHGASIPALDHVSVELRITAKKPVSWLRRRLNHSLIRKRAHEVRGHWRTYLDKSSGELKAKIWIESHERGDRNLGFVERSLSGGKLRLPRATKIKS